MEETAISQMIFDLKKLATEDSDTQPCDELIPSTQTQILGRVLEMIDREEPRLRTDREGRVVEINPSFSAMCGYSFSELKGRKPGSLLQGPETEPAALEPLREAIESGTAGETEIFNYHKNGTRYRVWIRIEPVRDSAGDLVGFQAFERKLA